MVAMGDGSMGPVGSMMSNFVEAKKNFKEEEEEVQQVDRKTLRVSWLVKKSFMLIMTFCLAKWKRWKHLTIVLVVFEHSILLGNVWKCVSTEATAMQNQRLTRVGSIRGSVRKSMRSMGSALSQLPEEQEQEEQDIYCMCKMRNICRQQTASDCGWWQRQEQQEADGPAEPEDAQETAVEVDEDVEEEEVSMEKFL